MSVLFRREPSNSGGSGGQRPAQRAPVERPTAAQLDEIGKIVEQRLVTAEFQPIVRIGTGETVGFESFARGPANSSLATPQAMFRAAAAAGKAAELDLIAANAAFTAVRFSPQRTDLTFFLNTNPAGLVTPQPRYQELFDAAVTALADLRVVIELPEQALLSDPLSTITAARWLRASGARIAIDNVGSLRGLALIPFLRPEIIKLSPTLVTSPVQRVAEVINAVVSYTERHGGLVVAQGIEQDGHARSAIGMGAALGQGWLFGHPMTVPYIGEDSTCEPLDIRAVQDLVEQDLTPYEVLAADRAPTRIDEAMFNAFATHLMDIAEARTEPFVMVISGSDSAYLGGGRSARLRALGHKASLLLLLTGDPGLVATRDLRVVPLAPEDRLRDERVLALVSPYAASLLTARPIGDGTYDCLLSHDRSLVLRAARGLINRATEPVEPQSVPDAASAPPAAA